MHFIKSETFYATNYIIKKQKDDAQNRIKIMYLIRQLYPKYIKKTVKTQ